MTRTAQRIIEIIAEEYNLDLNFWYVKSRKRTYQNPRKIFYNVMYNKEGMSMSAISQMCGFKDHTTVQHHIKDSWDLSAIDSDFREKLFKVLEEAEKMY
jgi:chromosomal replication initiator protein